MQRMCLKSRLKLSLLSNAQAHSHGLTRPRFCKLQHRGLLTGLSQWIKDKRSPKPTLGNPKQVYDFEKTVFSVKRPWARQASSIICCGTIIAASGEYCHILLCEGLHNLVPLMLCSVSILGCNGVLYYLRKNVHKVILESYFMPVYNCKVYRLRVQTFGAFGRTITQDMPVSVFVGMLPACSVKRMRELRDSTRLKRIEDKHTRLFMELSKDELSLKQLASLIKFEKELAPDEHASAQRHIEKAGDINFESEKPSKNISKRVKGVVRKNVRSQTKVKASLY
eukprot:336369_1